MKMGPEDPVVDGDHDDDRAPEGHEGGEEGVGEVRVEDAQASVFTNCRFPRPYGEDIHYREHSQENTGLFGNFSRHTGGGSPQSQTFVILTIVPKNLITPFPKGKGLVQTIPK